MGVLGASIQEISGTTVSNSIRIWDVKSSFPISELPDSPKRNKYIQIFQEAVWHCGRGKKDLNPLIFLLEYTVSDNVPINVTTSLEPSFSWNSSSTSESNLSNTILMGTSSGLIQLLQIHDPIPISCAPSGAYAMGTSTEFMEGTPDVTLTSTLKKEGDETDENVPAYISRNSSFADLDSPTPPTFPKNEL